jgi:hypothetical protein
MRKWRKKNESELKLKDENESNGERDFVLLMRCSFVTSPLGLKEIIQVEAGEAHPSIRIHIIDLAPTLNDLAIQTCNFTVKSCFPQYTIRKQSTEERQSVHKFSTSISTIITIQSPYRPCASGIINSARVSSPDQSQYHTWPHLQPKLHPPASPSQFSSSYPP